MNARDLYRAGKLAEATTAMTAEVKSHPVDTLRRGFLAELLILSGELERADKHLDLIADQEPQGAPAIGMLRQILRAEGARRDFWNDGRVPQFVGEPTETMRLLLQASIAERDGDHEEAAKLAAGAEEARPAVSGMSGDVAFDDMRDLDDLCGGVIEILTTLGTYLWVPTEAFESIAFHEPKRPRDLLWRGAAVAVTDGPEGEVFIPAVYHGADLADAERLGRSTEWTGGDGAPVRGRGQRTFLVGDEALPMLELSSLIFDSAGHAARAESAESTESPE